MSNIQNQKSALAKLLATENLTVQHQKIPSDFVSYHSCRSPVVVADFLVHRGFFRIDRSQKFSGKNYPDRPEFSGIIPRDRCMHFLHSFWWLLLDFLLR
jgi:hypothetical protein